MRKLIVPFTDALTGQPFTVALTQEFIASLPTKAQWDTIGAPPATPPPPGSVTDGGAIQHPDDTGGFVAQYVIGQPALDVQPDTRYFIACIIGGVRVEITEIVAGMCEPSHLLDIHAGRTFHAVARNEWGEAVSEFVASDNAFSYDGLL